MILKVETVLCNHEGKKKKSTSEGEEKGGSRTPKEPERKRDGKKDHYTSPKVQIS